MNGAITPIVVAAFLVASPTPAGAEDARARAYFTDLVLENQDGRPVRFYSDVLEGRIVVIGTFYTHCPDACPLLVHKLKSVEKSLRETKNGAVEFVLISVDPERDTPRAMRRFARRLKIDRPGWTLLSGEPTRVHDILKRLGQYRTDFRAHSTLLFGANVSAEHWTKIPPTASPAKVAAKMRELISRHR